VEAPSLGGIIESTAKQKPRTFGDEFKERAVRLVSEWRPSRNRDDAGLTEIRESECHVLTSTRRCR
jgi:hypothetical protein